jgi:RNA polymerase-binding transcription factor DksA
MSKVTGGWRSGAHGSKGYGTWRRLDLMLERARTRPARWCMACGKRISTTRLRALPLTEFCTACEVARASETVSDVDRTEGSA